MKLKNELELYVCESVPLPLFIFRQNLVKTGVYLLEEVEILRSKVSKGFYEAVYHPINQQETNAQCNSNCVFILFLS